MISAFLWFVGAAAAGSLSGTVRDEGGEPIPDVTVVAYDARLAYSAVLSADDGSWTIGGLPAGPYRVRAAPPDASGFVDRFFPDGWDYCVADRFDVTLGGSIDGVDMVLPLGGELSGRLVDVEGAPIVGATVVLEGQTARTALGMRVTTSDDDGRFAAVGLDADPGTTEPWRCFFDPVSQPRQFAGETYVEDDASVFDIGPDTVLDLGDLPLLPGITVSGTVYGPDGPVETGGAVYVYSSSQAVSTAVQTDGTYQTSALPPGNVISWADSPGYATTYYPDADRPGESVEALEEGAVVSGVDLDAPYESTLTLRFSGDGDVGELSVLLYNSTYTVARGSPVGDDGEVTIDGLFPGEFTLYAYGGDGGFVDGFVADEAGEPRVFVVDGRTVEDLVLPLGASLSGVVLDDDGEPVYGAYVSASPTDGDTNRTVVTDHDGLYTLTGLTAGTWVVSAQYLHYCPADAGYVRVWWEASLTEEGSLPLSLAVGEQRAGLDFVLPRDDDHDAMGDAWEAENGLDPTVDDAAGDADGDGYTNLDEYLLGTDPTSPQGVGGCCAGDKGAAGAWIGLGGLALALRRRRTRRG